MKSSEAKNKIVYGDVNLGPEYFEPKNQKIRITTFLDGEVLEWLKEFAKQKDSKYQTLLNEILRKVMINSQKKQHTVYARKFDFSNLPPEHREIAASILEAIRTDMQEALNFAQRKQDKQQKSKSIAKQARISSKPTKRSTKKAAL